MGTRKQGHDLWIASEPRCVVRHLSLGIQSRTSSVSQRPVSCPSPRTRGIVKTADEERFARSIVRTATDTLSIQGDRFRSRRGHDAKERDVTESVAIRIGAGDRGINAAAAGRERDQLRCVGLDGDAVVEIDTRYREYESLMETISSLHVPPSGSPVYTKSHQK